MTYKAGDQVRDEFNVPIHKLIFQKIKRHVSLGNQAGLYWMRIKMSSHHAL